MVLLMQKKDITLHNIGNERLREKPNSISVRYFEDKSMIYGSRGMKSVCSVESSVFSSLLIMASLGASCSVALALISRREAGEQPGAPEVNLFKTQSCFAVE